MLVSTTVENQIVPFTKMVEKSGNERLKGNMVRQFMMTVGNPSSSCPVPLLTHLRQTILHYVLEIAARFDLYVDISEMYVEVNDNHILPGFTIVDKMGAVTAAGEEGREQLQEKNKELQKYSAGAQTGIGEIITKVKPSNAKKKKKKKKKKNKRKEKKRKRKGNNLLTFVVPENRGHRRLQGSYRETPGPSERPRAARILAPTICCCH